MSPRLAARLRELAGLDERPSRWGADPAFWAGGREIVHFHGDEVEIRLTARLIGRLDDPRIARRTRTSDWVAVPVAEEELALELARAALDANRR